VNALERARRRLVGEPVDRPPNFNIYMQFAAHAIGRPLSEYYLDHRVLVEANLAMVERFGADIVQAISDPYRETHDFGAAIEFPRDGLPLCRRPLLDAPEKLRQLRRPDPASGRRMSDRLEAVRLLREKVGGEVPVMGWVEGALAEAVDLRGLEALFLDLHDRPGWVAELLEICAETAVAFARAQVRAGADLVGLGDAAASLVSPKQYRALALPYEQRVFRAVHEEGGLGRLHICGDTSAILEPMAESGADIVDLDWLVDLGAAARTWGSRVAPGGNFDPVAVMLRGTPGDVQAAVRRCLREGGERLFSAAGCEIPDGTPPANLLAQRQALENSPGASPP